jgi:hypothetical protein
MVVRPSSTEVAVISEGGALDSPIAVATDSPSSTCAWQQLSARRLGTGLRRHDPRALGQALHGREAEHAGVGIPVRKQKQG